jgi:hypothetical protein
MRRSTNSPLNSEGKEVLEITRDPPPRISVLVGEIVYQVRSALDHLTYVIVEANQTNIVLQKNWVRDCAFPLMLKAPIDNARRRLSAFYGQLFHKFTAALMN